MKGSKHQGRYKGLAFLWNVMDKKTRFLLASKVSENTDANRAIAVLQEAIKNANDNSPSAINTQMLTAPIEEKAYQRHLKC